MTTTPMKVTSDFDFLSGSFDVTDRQLRAPLTGSDEWEEHTGTCTGRTLFDGAVTITEMQLPSRGFYGLCIQLFDPVAKDWTAYRVNGQTGRLQLPLRGTWMDGVGVLSGQDQHDGEAVLVNHRWSDVTTDTARWEQAFSVDDGATWETNWQMEFTRRSDEPPRSDRPKVTGDFDFLAGRWKVAHRRLTAPLTGDDRWYDLPGTLDSWTHFDGMVSIDDNGFPTKGFRGLTIRLYDPAERQWSIYWVNSQDGRLQPPVHGRWTGDTSEFEGDDDYEGRPIRARFHWTKGKTPIWEQHFSPDGGRTWEANWHMTFTRA